MNETGGKGRPGLARSVEGIAGRPELGDVETQGVGAARDTPSQ